MRKVIASLSAISILVIAGASVLFLNVPKATPSQILVLSESNQTREAIAAPGNLSQKQRELMSLAYQVGEADGHQRPEIVQSVLLQETLAGGMNSYRVANPGPEAYFGPMQIKLAAAKDVLKKWPELFSKYDFHTRSDDEIKANLILNEQFNIEVGSKYLMLLHKTYGFTGRRLMNAYNRGPGGVNEVDDTFHYAVQAERKLAKFKNEK